MSDQIILSAVEGLGNADIAKVIAEVGVVIAALCSFIYNTYTARTKKKKDNTELYSALVEENQGMMTSFIDIQKNQYETWIEEQNGKFLMQSKEIELLKEEISSLRKEIRALHVDLNDKIKLITEKEIELEKALAEIERLREKIREKNIRIAELEAELRK